MWIEPLRWNCTQQSFLVIQQNRTRRVVLGCDAVDKDYSSPTGNSVREVERGRAQIGKLDFLIKGVFRFKETQNIRPEPIISEQHVPHTANQYAVHRIFAVLIFRPEGSNAWHAHAMQGSNECTVRRTSSGSSGLASGVCSKEASYGPCAPA